MQYPLVNCDRLISAITQLRRLLRLIQERKKWRLEYIRTVIVQKCVRQKPTVAHDAICLRLFDNSAKLKNFIILFIFIIFGTTYLLSSRNLKNFQCFKICGCENWGYMLIVCNSYRKSIAINILFAIFTKFLVSRCKLLISFKRLLNDPLF